MAQVSRNKKFVSLDDVRVSYRPKDDSIHLMSGDPEFPQGFHLPLQKGSFVESQMRDLLVEHGLIDPDSEPVSILPARAPWSADYILNNEVRPSFFSLGIARAGEVDFRDPVSRKLIPLTGIDFDGTNRVASLKDLNSKNSELLKYDPPTSVLLTGSPGSGKTVLIHSFLAGVGLRPQHWSAVVFASFNGEYREYGEYDNITLESTGEHTVENFRNLREEVSHRFKLMFSEVDLSTTESTLVSFEEQRKLREKYGLNNVLVIVDEFMGILSQLSDEDKIEATDNLMHVMRFGRAAGFRVVVSTQSAENLFEGFDKPVANDKNDDEKGFWELFQIHIAVGQNALASAFANEPDAAVRLRELNQMPSMGRALIQFEDGGSHLMQSLEAFTDVVVPAIDWENKKRARKNVCEAL